MREHFDFSAAGGFPAAEKSNIFLCELGGSDLFSSLVLAQRSSIVPRL
jgi:hypothetical protein